MAILKCQKPLSWEEIQSRLQDKHGDKIILTKRRYSGDQRIPSIFKCSSGHEWTAPLGRIFQGHGCPDCGTVSAHAKTSMTPKEYLDRLKASKANYLVPLEEYKGALKRILHKCSLCKDERKYIPHHLMNFGIGCANCWPDSERINWRTRSLSDYSNHLKELNSPLIPLEKCIGRHAKIKHLCDKGHTITISPHYVLNTKCRCPMCYKRKAGSNVANKWISKIARLSRLKFISVLSSTGEYQVTRPGKNPLKVDGYNIRSNLILEFLGDYWHGRLNRENSRRLRLLSRTRINYLLQRGFNVLFVWGGEQTSLFLGTLVYHNTPPIISDRIRIIKYEDFQSLNGLFRKRASK